MRVVSISEPSFDAGCHHMSVAPHPSRSLLGDKRSSTDRCREDILLPQNSPQESGRRQEGPGEQCGLLKSSDYHRIEAAIRFIVEHADEQPRLSEIAQFLGLSEFHCHRLFHRWAGVTPKDFLQLVTLERAKAALREKRSVMNAALDAGLSGASRLHDLFLTVDAMTPGEFRRAGAGLTIRWAIHPTPLGDALFAMTDRGLCTLKFPNFDDDNREEALNELKAAWPAARLVPDRKGTMAVAHDVTERMRGRTDQPLAVLLKGTPFQIKVWQALLAVGPGEVTTYGELASAIGQPSASRATGSAVGANPVAFLIPCHRVLRASGVVGGYRWGTDRKRAALVLDSVQGANFTSRETAA
jgi:AraC family transcriptional regulator, regulatory protein of adaptative response / methylated-DNA-[protein]-cysteine methyltransferase